jgi:hypothetical protein
MGIARAAVLVASAESKPKSTVLRCIVTNMVHSFSSPAPPPVFTAYWRSPRGSYTILSAGGAVLAIIRRAKTARAGIDACPCRFLRIATAVQRRLTFSVRPPESRSASR